MDIPGRFKNNISKFALGDRPIRIALSGGSDSIALLELFRVSELETSISALHVDHQIRNCSSRDSEFVSDFCAKRGIPLDILKIDVPKYAENNSMGLEEAARFLRYRIFREYIERGEIIATGHTAGDVIETMLFNFFRGSGPRGLAGIPNTRDGIIRPLLDFWRKELQDWLKANEISWCEDESNLDLRFTRNKIRWMLVPELKRIFGEGVIERIRREADIFTACAEFIDDIAVRLTRENLITEFDNVKVLRNNLQNQTLWEFGEIVRKAMVHFDIGHAPMGFDTIKRLYNEIHNSRRGRRYPVYSNIHIECDSSMLFLFGDMEKIDKRRVQENSETRLPFNMGILKILESGNGEEIFYDGGELSLKTAAAGDRIDAKHKLRRVLARKGVPRFLRDIVPVLYSGKIPIYSPLVGKLANDHGLFKIHIDIEGPVRDLRNIIRKV